MLETLRQFADSLWSVALRACADIPVGDSTETTSNYEVIFAGLPAVGEALPLAAAIAAFAGVGIYLFAKGLMPQSSPTRDGEPRASIR